MINPIRIHITSLDYHIEAEGTHPGTRDAIFALIGIDQGNDWHGLDTDLLAALQALGAVQITRAATLNGVMPSIVLRAICHLGAALARKVPRVEEDVALDCDQAELPQRRPEVTQPSTRAPRKAPCGAKKGPRKRRSPARG